MQSSWMDVRLYWWAAWVEDPSNEYNPYYKALLQVSDYLRTFVFAVAIPALVIVMMVSAVLLTTDAWPDKGVLTPLFLYCMSLAGVALIREILARVICWVCEKHDGAVRRSHWR